MHLVRVDPIGRTDITYGTENITFSRVISRELYTINHPLHEKITLKEFTNLVERASTMDNVTFKTLSESLHT